MGQLKDEKFKFTSSSCEYAYGLLVCYTTRTIKSNDAALSGALYGGAFERSQNEKRWCSESFQGGRSECRAAKGDELNR